MLTNGLPLVWGLQSLVLRGRGGRAGEALQQRLLLGSHLWAWGGFSAFSPFQFSWQVNFCLLLVKVSITSWATSAGDFQDTSFSGMLSWQPF